MNPSKYIILASLQRKKESWFFTLNDLDEPESEKIKDRLGNIIYNILGYANTPEEAAYKIKLSRYELKRIRHEEGESILIGWLIKTDKSKYYSIDESSGGYPCWTSYFSHALIFKNKKEAISILENKAIFEDTTKMGNGTIYPPRMIHIATGVNNKKLTGTATISIVPLITGKPVITKKFIGEIIRPKEY